MKTCIFKLLAAARKGGVVGYSVWQPK